TSLALMTPMRSLCTPNFPLTPPPPARNRPRFCSWNTSKNRELFVQRRTRWVFEPQVSCHKIEPFEAARKPTHPTFSAWPKKDDGLFDAIATLLPIGPVHAVACT